MLTRDDVEKNYRKVIEEYGYGTTIWSPLAGGILTGKYNDGVKPETPRFTYPCSSYLTWMKFFNENDKEHTLKLLNELAEVAAELNCTQAELALAWTIVNKDVSTAIFGATKISQVQSNLKSVEIASKWTPELEKRIETIVGTQPEPAMDWNAFAPLKPRRSEAIDYDFELPKVSSLMKAAQDEMKKSSEKS